MMMLRSLLQWLEGFPCPVSSPYVESPSVRPLSHLGTFPPVFAIKFSGRFYFMVSASMFPFKIFLEVPPYDRIVIISVPPYGFQCGFPSLLNHFLNAVLYD